MVAFSYTPFAVPCLFLLATDLPCPACGLSRAGVHLLRFEWLAALHMNILLFPLLLLGGAYFIAAVMDAFLGKAAIARINSWLGKKWIIAVAAVLMLSSWALNLLRWG